MFDLSFGKLAILFALCLIVLGPEKLPKLAQQLGRWTGQARAMARHFRAQLEQEIAAGEFAKQRQELEAAVKSSIDAASSPLDTLTQTVDDAVKQFPTLPEIDPSASNGSGHGEYDPNPDPAAALDPEPAISTPIASPEPRDDAKPNS